MDYLKYMRQRIGKEHPADIVGDMAAMEWSVAEIERIRALAANYETDMMTLATEGKRLRMALERISRLPDSSLSSRDDAGRDIASEALANARKQKL